MCAVVARGQVQHPGIDSWCLVSERFSPCGFRSTQYLLDQGCPETALMHSPPGRHPAAAGCVTSSATHRAEQLPSMFLKEDAMHWAPETWRRRDGADNAARSCASYSHLQQTQAETNSGINAMQKTKEQ